MAANKLVSRPYFVEENKIVPNETYQQLVLNDNRVETLPDYVFLLYGGYVVLIFLFGVIQNSMTLFVFLKDRRLWNVHNYFIVGLAIGDIGMCVCSHWMIITSAFRKAWIFGRLGCTFYGFITTTFGITQISLLAAIAFDRYAIIVKPRGFRITRTATIKIIIGCYCYGLFWALCPVLGWNSYQSEGLRIRCAINWQSHRSVDLSFSMTILVLGWLLPLSLILFSYGSIFRMTKSEERKAFNRRTKKRQRLERKMAITVLLMIGAFFISWTPYSLVTLIVAFGRIKVPVVVSVFPALIAKTSIIWNPIIYVARHSAFRQACFEIVPCLVRYRHTHKRRCRTCSDDNIISSKSSEERTRRNGMVKEPRLRRQRMFLVFQTRPQAVFEEDSGSCSVYAHNSDMRKDRKVIDETSFESISPHDPLRRHSVATTFKPYELQFMSPWQWKVGENLIKKSQSDNLLLSTDV